MNPSNNSRLLVILGDAVKEVQLCISCPGGCKRYEINVAARLIHALDHVLLDGLRIPKNGYWPVFAALLPSSVLSFINQLSSAANNISKGRAWLLLSLNEAVLEAFLATLEDRPSHLSEHYLPNALLRDSTSLQVVITLVSGLEHVGFDFLLDSAFLNANQPPSSGFLVDYEPCESPLENAEISMERAQVDDVIDVSNAKKDNSFLGEQKTTMPVMKSPLVKRRTSAKSQHVRSSTQKRVSFHQDMMRRPYDESLQHATSQNNLNISSYVEDRTTLMRRYHSELAIDHAASTLAKYPTIAERGVPEGQEDPEGAKTEHAAPEMLFLQKALIRRKLLMGEQPKKSTKDKRQFFDWAKQKWEDLNLVPVLPHLSKQLLDVSDNDLVTEDVPQVENSFETIPLPVEMDPNERYKSFKCFTNFYSGIPLSSQLVISPTIIYIVSSTASLDNSPSIVWKCKLIDLEDVKVKCNYSVIVMRSKSAENGGLFCLDFADPADLQMAASLIDVNVRRIRKDCQCVYVESVSQCQTYWQPRVLQWIRNGTHSIDMQSPIDIEYIGMLYFEESFVMQSHEISPGACPNKSGHLMYRWSTTRSWHAGYFIIKDGVLYQFNQPNDRVPVLTMSLSEEECKGYGRNFHSRRPHTIELQFRNEKSLLLAAASENEATEWLTSLSQSSFVWDNVMDVASPVQHSSPIACGVLVTRQQVFLFQSTDQQQPVASAPLDLISVIMISLTDTFCLIELDYREASDGAGDWILYFQSKQSFEEFLRATKRPREILSTASSSTLRNKSLLLRAI
ncbi:pleckstrin homology domain-containing family M member 2-like isoform X2 [Daphnia carinata]|nr:pleckstrin homology domain-containing family M member 2-like isoform X2 [Daphnia carinata]XP_059350201.1 pleckstrin homology domain-containing family M member 2-like isoform X2 [Daphnia carinata]XP_059350202.1 pleckstrin homology domain-containing family M member 2-like isoform X2 [Daphnia carinata]